MGEFKAFLARGNVLDLAVAVIIGAAFATIVSSLTDDIIMPVVGAIFGGLDFSNKFVLLGSMPDGYHGATTYSALKEAGVPVLGYGQFLTTSLNFLILAFVIFQLVRTASRLSRKPDGQPEATAEEVVILREIRDELKRKS